MEVKHLESGIFFECLIFYLGFFILRAIFNITVLKRKWYDIKMNF